MKRGIVTSRQFTLLVALFVIGDTILYLPAKIVQEGQQDAWLSGVLGIAAGLAIVTMYGALAGQYPRQHVLEMYGSAFGKMAGTVVGVAAILFFIIDAGVVLWQVGDFMVTHIMPETPIQSFLILFMAVVVLGYRLGIGTIARSAEIFFYLVLFLFVVLILLLIPEIEPKRLLPVYEKGANPVLRGSLLLVGYYCETVILMMALPAIRPGQRVGRAYRIGMLIGSLVLAVTILICLLVLGAPITTLQLFTSFVLAKKISIADFLERIEVFMATLWFLTLFVKLFVCFYAAAIGTSRLLKLKDDNVLSLPLAALVIVASFVIVPTSIYFNQFIQHTWWAFSATFGLLIPAVMLGSVWVRSWSPVKK
ncbi:MAG: yndE 2 [Paenibacillus sp.]|jgi:spore germination protein KB|nr:yndE 2 [Paenibacillus sp.]